jgi:hypothetical protein
MMTDASKPGAQALDRVNHKIGDRPVGVVPRALLPQPGRDMLAEQGRDVTIGWAQRIVEHRGDQRFDDWLGRAAG